MMRQVLAAALLLLSHQAWADDYRIVSIEPAGRVIVYVVEPDSKRRFQAAVGTVIGPSETVLLGAPTARVVVVDLNTGRRLQITQNSPMRKPASDLLGRLRTRLADIGRLSANMGATQSSAPCAARPDFAIPDIPVLAGGTAVLESGRQRLVLPLRLREGETGQLVLINERGHPVLTAHVEQPWWQGPRTDELETGDYRVLLTSAGGAYADRLLTIAEEGPPEAPDEIQSNKAAVELEAIRLSTIEGGRWRLQALATALAVPRAARSESLNQLIRLLGEGVRLHDPAAVAACLDP